MPTGISLRSKIYDVTLEESKSGKADSSDWDQNKIPIDFYAGSVSGVFDNDAGTGTNYWSAYSGSMVDGFWLHMCVDAVAAMIADTAYWVTYKTDSQFVAMGVPMAGENGILATVPTILSGITAISDNGTPVDYEISGLVTGQTLAAAIPFVPPLSGVVITQIEVNTDGTDVDIGIYQGDQTTGTVLNLKFKKETINQTYNSSTEYPNLRVVIEDDSWRLGVVDNNTNAAPANTTVTVRGYPLI